MLKSAHCIKPTGEIKEFKIDDVVLINDEKFPRHFWKLGKVVDVFPGRDGKIRSLSDYCLAVDSLRVGDAPASARDGLLFCREKVINPRAGRAIELWDSRFYETLVRNFALGDRVCIFRGDSGRLIQVPSLFSKNVPTFLTPNVRVATRGLLVTDHVILNHVQVTWTTPELAPPSPNYHTKPTPNLEKRSGISRQMWDGN
ncbi:integrase catalytic domain-containing protein [Trichonephila clavipes]|nr:integrase catalytic domain-containing protein [Trichonephila clavipes]